MTVRGQWPGNGRFSRQIGARHPLRVVQPTSESSHENGPNATLGAALLIDYFWTDPTASGSTGSAAVTEDADTATASGTTTILGTSAQTETADTSTAAGTTTVLGTSSQTEAADTSTASGTTTVVGSSATTEDPDTATASGSVGGGATITGTAAVTEDPDTATAAGTTTVVGASATTEDADTGTATGWAGTITGTLAVTEDDDIASAAGVSGTFTPPDDGHSHSSGGSWPKARLFPQPPKLPIVLPTIHGTARCLEADDLASASGEIDPFNLLADDEELLLLV